MVKKGNKKSSNFKLDTLADVKQLIEDVLAEARDGNDMFESASKLSSLLGIWCRANQMEIATEELEVRIAKLEQRERERMEREGSM